MHVTCFPMSGLFNTKKQTVQVVGSPLFVCGVVFFYIIKTKELFVLSELKFAFRTGGGYEGVSFSSQNRYKCSFYDLKHFHGVVVLYSVWL